MIKFSRYFAVVFSCAVFLSGCHKPRNFYADDNDPGLSRFTSRSYDILTLYINDTAYINPYVYYRLGGSANSTIDIQKLQTGSAQDTLSITWQIENKNTPANAFTGYLSLSLLLPVEPNFTKADFSALEGKRFSSGATIRVTGYNGLDSVLSGPANIYFVKTGAGNSSSAESFSGLFEGSAGNSVQITRGRFDFSVNISSLNF